MEFKSEVRMFSIIMKCDKCEKGLMVYTGMMLPSDPPKYTHKCQRCEYTENYNVSYPVYRYEPV